MEGRGGNNLIHLTSEAKPRRSLEARMLSVCEGVEDSRGAEWVSEVEPSGGGCQRASDQAVT